MPERVQQLRVKGWRKPAGVVSVTRATKWGNPYKVMRDGGFMWVEPEGSRIVCSTDRAGNLRERRVEAVALFRERWVPLHAEAIKAELRGRYLMCFCPLDQPCHADVLLEIANEGGTDE